MIIKVAAMSNDIKVDFEGNLFNKTCAHLQSQ